MPWQALIREVNPHRAFLVAGGNTARFEPMLENGRLPYYADSLGDSFRHVYSNECFTLQYSPAMDITNTLRFHSLLANCSGCGHVSGLQACPEALGVVVRFKGAAASTDFRELARTKQLTV
jgi:hypothetical protein